MTSHSASNYLIGSDQSLIVEIVQTVPFLTIDHYPRLLGEDAQSHLRSALHT
jgi:hypothetical protein